MSKEKTVFKIGDKVECMTDIYGGDVHRGYVSRVIAVPGTAFYDSFPYLEAEHGMLVAVGLEFHWYFQRDWKKVPEGKTTKKRK